MTHLTEEEKKAMARCMNKPPGPLSVFDAAPEVTLGGAKVLLSSSGESSAYCMDPLDAYFYANARTDLTLALSEIDRLRGMIADAPHDEHCDGYDWDYREETGLPCDCWKSSLEAK